jgi:hypothetical protein
MAEQNGQPEQQQEITGTVKEAVVLPPSDYLAEVTLIKPKTIKGNKGDNEVLEFTFKLLDADPNAKSTIARGIAGFPDKQILVGRPLYKWCCILAGAEQIVKDKDFKISSLIGKKCKVITENKQGTGTYSNFTFINVKDVLALKPKDLESLQQVKPAVTATTPQVSATQTTTQAATTSTTQSSSTTKPEFEF